MAYQYAGRLLPKRHRSPAYRDGRLPESERAGQLPGLGKLHHSTTITVADSSRNYNQGDIMRGLNKMFNHTVKATEKPRTTRAGSADLSSDPMFQALKGLPVVHKDDGDWCHDGQKYSEDQARKLQSKIAAYAKAGAGTFRTSYNRADGHVYLKRIAETYTVQRGADAA